MARRELEPVDAEFVVVEGERGESAFGSRGSGSSGAGSGGQDGDPPPPRTLDIGPSARGAWSWWGTALWIGALVAALGWTAWSEALELALHGWDTYPLIAASRVEGAGGLGAVLTDELMGGRFPGGRYWRPLVHASFALDHAFGGLDPRAYHRTDLLATLAGGVAVSWLALALFGGKRRLWAAIAGFLFVLHPVHFELAPFPPRRADSLSLAFTLFALVCAARARTRTSYVAALFAFLAACAKETGVLCALLIPTLASSFELAPTWWQRLRGGLRASWPTLVAIAFYLTLRTAILGGLGGGARASVAGAASGFFRASARYAELVLAPAPPSEWASAGAALAFGAAALVVLAWTLARSRARELTLEFTSGFTSVSQDDSGLADIEPRRLAAWLGVWLAALVALTAMSGVFRAWYAAPFAAPIALLAAAACAWRQHVMRRRFLALAALAVLALLQGWTSNGQQRWLEIRASSDAARELVTRFDALVATAPAGSVHELDAAPPQESASRHGVATRRPMTLREYSLQAYADLAHPSKRLRVVAKRPEPPTAAADEVVIVLVGRSAEAGE
jgi:hypothetical protein